MQIKPFYDVRTLTVSYVVYDEASKDAVIIDPVLDYDPASSKVWAESVEQIIDFVRSQNLGVHYILETHAHADHLSGSQLLKRAFPDARIALGERITVVQQTFKTVFDLSEDFPTDGSQFEESLTNALKHSGARAVSVALQVTQTGEEAPVLQIRITDNGKGIAGERVGGRGLMNMRSRANKIGGTLTLESVPGTGTRVSFVYSLSEYHTGLTRTSTQMGLNTEAIIERFRERGS